MNKGYVKLWRKALDSGMLKNHEVWVFWTYCLLKATHKPCKAIIGNQEVFLEPGQFVFGRRKAAEETNLSERQIRTCLDILKKWENVTIKTTNKYSVITIVKWQIYQQSIYENDHQNDQQPANKVPHTRNKEHENKIIISLFDRWNSLNIIRHRDIQKFQSNLNAALKNYSAEEITQAMENYAKVYFGEEYFYSYKWRLRDFLQRGLDRFIPENFRPEDYIKAQGGNKAGNASLDHWDGYL